MKFVFRTLITPNFFRILLPWLHSLVQLANNNVQQSFCTRQGQSNAADEAQICMPCRSTCARQTQKVLAGLKVSPLRLHFPLQPEAQSRKPQVAACVCVNTVRLLIKSSCCLTLLCLSDSALPVVIIKARPSSKGVF